MIRRAFIRMFSGAVFASLLGVKVETWKDTSGLWPVAEPTLEPAAFDMVWMASKDAAYHSAMAAKWARLAVPSIGALPKALEP